MRDIGVPEIKTSILWLPYRLLFVLLLPFSCGNMRVSEKQHEKSASAQTVPE